MQKEKQENREVKVKGKTDEQKNGSGALGTEAKYRELDKPLKQVSADKDE